MTRRVSISEKSARAAMDALDAVPDYELSLTAGQALRELRSALRPSPKRVAATKAKREAKQSKREAKNTETARIRRHCVERSAGQCECGCGRPINSETAHMDHFAGRIRLPQSVETCWMLHPDCDRAKTLNKPSAIYWHQRFLVHAKRYGYRLAATYAEVRIESAALTEQAAAVNRGED